MEEIQVNAAKEEKKEPTMKTIVDEVEITKGNVSNEKIEESLNYDLLTQEEKDAIDEFNKKIDVNDATQVLQYGAKAQTKISQFSDSVLDGVKTKNAGEVGKGTREIY